MDEESKYVQSWARPFFVNETPYCFWDPDIAEHNMLFIKQLDVGYFEFVAEHYWSILGQRTGINQRDDKESQYAAIGLRIAYSQALEVLFSWLFAALQAPECVIGWVSRYKMHELTELIRKVHGRSKFLSRFPDLEPGWDGIVELLFRGVDETVKVEQAKVLESFVHLLANFAQDFLNQDFSDEYNSLKHGLRSHMGGYQLAIGLPHEQGNPPLEDKFETVNASDFGSTFFTSQKLNGPNYAITQSSRNWAPENYFEGLKLISATMKNIVVMLKQLNGDRSEYFLLFPNDPDFARKPWRKVSNQSMKIQARPRVDRLPLMSNNEILESYENP